jgi:hypothetical protein
VQSAYKGSEQNKNKKSACEDFCLIERFSHSETVLIPLPGDD